MVDTEPSDSGGADGASGPGGADGTRDGDGVGDSCDCKIGRVAREFGVDLDDDLRRRWTGEDGDRDGVRALAAHVNRRVLAAAARDAGAEFLDGEAANAYRLLTGDDVSSGQRTHARNRLERDGVDVAAVEDAFVSHQTVHAHLTDCLDVTYDARDGEHGTVGGEAVTADTAATVGALKGRAEAVTDDALARLRDDGRLHLGEFTVVVDMSVACEDCGAQYDVGSLLDRGGCDCPGNES